MQTVEHVGKTEPGAEEAIQQFAKRAAVGEAVVVKLDDGDVVWATVDGAAHIHMGIAMVAVDYRRPWKKEGYESALVPLYNVWLRDLPTPPWVAPQAIPVAALSADAGGNHG